MEPFGRIKQDCRLGRHLDSKECFLTNIKFGVKDRPLRHVKPTDRLYILAHGDAADGFALRALRVLEDGSFHFGMTWEKFTPLEIAQQLARAGLACDHEDIELLSCGSGGSFKRHLFATKGTEEQPSLLPGDMYDHYELYQGKGNLPVADKLAQAMTQVGFCNNRSGVNGDSGGPVDDLTSPIIGAYVPMIEIAAQRDGYRPHRTGNAGFRGYFHDEAFIGGKVKGIYQDSSMVQNIEENGHVPQNQGPQELNGIGAYSHIKYKDSTEQDVLVKAMQDNGMLKDHGMAPSETFLKGGVLENRNYSIFSRRCKKTGNVKKTPIGYECNNANECEGDLLCINYGCRAMPLCSPTEKKCARDTDISSAVISRCRCPSGEEKSESTACLCSPREENRSQKHDIPDVLCKKDESCTDFGCSMDGVATNWDQDCSTLERVGECSDKNETECASGKFCTRSWLKSCRCAWDVRENKCKSGCQKGFGDQQNRNICRFGECKYKPK
eukprot:g1411.t1